MEEDGGLLGVSLRGCVGEVALRDCGGEVVVNKVG